MSTMEGSTAMAELEPEAKSFLSRLVGVFVSPGETFADIVRRPDFIAPLVVSIAFSVVFTESLIQKIGFDAIVRWAIEHSRQVASMPPDQVQQTVQRFASFQTIAAHVAGVLWPPVFVLIIAVIGLVVVNSVFGEKINFKTAFSVPCYAYLVIILPAIISTVMIFFGDSGHLIANPQNPAPTSLGFFLNPLEVSKPLLALAGSLDIFSFWFLALLGIGFSEAARRRVKPLSVFLIFFGLWVVMVLGKMGLSTLGS